jgi:UDP-N-acetylglucosamine acyltransferase
MSKIYPSAILGSRAKLGENIEVSQCAIFHDDFEIGSDCYIGPHAVIYDGAGIGNRVRIFQLVSATHTPQDLSFERKYSVFYVRYETTVREFAIIHQISCRQRKNNFI